MTKLAVVFLGMLWSLVCHAQKIPDVRAWVDVFEEVRQHALFHELDVRYAKAPARNIGNTPLGIIPYRDIRCTVVIAEGDNPKMQAIMAFGSTPSQVHALMLTAAAHELGHCLRVRQKQMSSQFWALVAATDEGSAQRHFMEQQASLEEAYADAYALVYMRDAHALVFADVLRMMQALRADPDFVTPYYRVEPLYAYLAQHAIEARGPLRQRVEHLVAAARFPQAQDVSDRLLDQTTDRP